jgi:hypothetical protein
MEEIYDQQGRMIGRLRGTMIYDRAGSKVVGYLNENYVRRQSNGRHVGYLCAGYFVDSSGFPVAVVAGGQGGPGLPHGVPVNRTGPLPGGPVPGHPHAPLRFWSQQTWKEYIGA